MSTHNVMIDNSILIDEIKWRSDEDYNLVRNGNNEVCIPTRGGNELSEGEYLFGSVDQARNLIKAIEKTIALGWIK